MFHIGLGGHLGPATRLGAVLSRQGHEVLAWGPAANRAQIEVEAVQFVEHEPLKANEPFASLPEFSANLAEATEACVEALIEELFDRDVELVVHDVHVPWGRIAADFLGIPRIVSNPLFPSTDPGRPVMNPQLRDWTDQEPASTPDEATAARERAYERVEAARVSLARKWGTELGDWNYAMNSVDDASVSVSYTTPDISGLSDSLEGWCFAGPLLDPPPTATRDTEPPLVYVAFGTYFNAQAGVFKLAIAALADEPMEVIVSTGRSKVTKAELEPLPRNVHVHDFVASREVLARASVHVTHAGCSSVHESLLAGVAMVCMPLGSDQTSWAQRVAELGAGEVVDMRPSTVRASVRRMLVDRTAAARARELGEELLRYDGEARVAVLVERALADAASMHSHNAAARRASV
jgi:MGT family glycosyltransferase